MKFQVNKDVLNDAISFVVRLLPQKNTLQILTGILIEADANALRLSVFDYEASAQSEVVAKVETSGRVLVSGRLLSDIVNRLPNAPVELSTDGSKVLVSCGSAKFTLPTMEVNSYPVLPELPPVSGTINGDKFAEAVNQVAIAASKEEFGKPQYRGVFIETSSKKLSLKATDMYRIATQDVDWAGTAAAEGLTALVPAKTLQEVAKTFANQGEISVSITRGDDRAMIAFKANNRSITSQLIKAEFPSVDQYMPTAAEHYAVVSTADLIESTKRVSLVIDRDSALKYTFNKNEVNLDGTGQETAQASENLAVEVFGDEVVVSLKPQYLIDGLSGTHSEFAKIIFTKSNTPHKPGPVLITAHSAKDANTVSGYRYLLQPNLLRK